MKLCTPALVYLVIAILALVWNFSWSIKSAIVHGVFIAMWTYVLNFICTKGYTNVAWALLVLPYVFTSFVALVTSELALFYNFGNSLTSSILAGPTVSPLFKHTY